MLPRSALNPGGGVRKPMQKAKNNHKHPYLVLGLNPGIVLGTFIQYHGGASFNSGQYSARMTAFSPLAGKPSVGR